MRKEPSRVAVAVIGACFLLITLCPSSRLSAEDAAPKPEYFGFYALDGGKLIAIGGGKSDTPPTLQQVNVVTLGAPQPSSRYAVRLGTGAHFLLFDVSPADAGRAVSMYRLPFVRNEITVPDVPAFGSSSGVEARPVNLPGVMRLTASQIPLLQKPVASQPQMIELVPDPKLDPGLYAVLYAPATSVTLGAGAGQGTGWTALLSIGQSSASGPTGQCIDLILTGGLGGMIGVGSPDMGSIASFPLLDPGRAPACSSASVSSASPVAAPSTPATRGSTRNLADLENDVEAGKDVSLPIQYNAAVPGYVYLQPGVVTLSKTTFGFQGADAFTVSTDKILEVTNEPQQASRVHVKVAIKNRKGDKEHKRDFYFYNTGATTVGVGPGGTGLSIECGRDRCGRHAPPCRRNTRGVPGW